MLNVNLNAVTLNMLTFVDSLWKFIFVWCAKFVDLISNFHFYPCHARRPVCVLCMCAFNKGNALHNERLMSQFIILISLLFLFSFSFNANGNHQQAGGALYQISIQFIVCVSIFLSRFKGIKFHHWHKSGAVGFVEIDWFLFGRE